MYGLKHLHQIFNVRNILIDTHSNHYKNEKTVPVIILQSPISFYGFSDEKIFTRESHKSLREDGKIDYTQDF